ncbi:MAG: hypothetical protein H6621_00115 [Halobacteriovoraceae bacterium]|nr:hypothetical protein [Halobacteriovoraceae bacterium]MCB9093444.1 hypothetical protein [Halobacteriovoraceae bacterium]
MTDRDLELFEFLFVSKIASRDQINKAVFGCVKKQTLNSRLSKLVGMHLLQRKAFIKAGRLTSCYENTQAALDKIKSRFKYKIRKDLIKSDAVEHDLGLVDLRSLLSKRRSVDLLITENVLQSCEDFWESNQFFPFVDLNSDALMRVYTNSGPRLVALEYESYNKSLARYRKKADAYYESQVQAVLYICSKKFIESILKKAEKEVYEKKGLTPKFYYCLEENVHNQIKEITFLNQNNFPVVL